MNNNCGQIIFYLLLLSSAINISEVLSNVIPNGAIIENKGEMNRYRSRPEIVNVRVNQREIAVNEG